jgi:flagellin
VEAVSGTFAVTGGDGANTDHGVDASVNINGSQAVTDGLDVSLRTSSLDVDMTLSETFGTQTSNTKTFYVTGGGADFNISPTVGISGLASLGISGVSTGSLGKGNIGYLTSLNSGATNDLASGNFETSQRIVREAISQVSTLRGRLGSFQKNTLDSTVNALQIAMENTSAAQSAVRDADFAQETANLTRAQILQQSSLSTLKMANQQPQNVLALLG